MPRVFMRPASASAMTSANISSIARAGRTSTRSRASSGPALANEWATPGSTRSTSPGPAMIVRSPTRKRISPATTSKRSLCSGCTCGIGTAPPGLSAKSNASSSTLGARRGGGEREALAGDRVLDGLAGAHARRAVLESDR